MSPILPITTIMTVLPMLAANAGEPAPGAIDPPPLEPVDALVEDLDPLAISLRELRSDLREPSAFERLYRVPGRPDLVMRVDGALYAVFPQSVYAMARGAPVALIPGGTVFHIGVPGESALPPQPAAPAELPGARADATRVDLRIADAPDPRAAPDRPVPAPANRIDLVAGAAGAGAASGAGAARDAAPTSASRALWSVERRLERSVDSVAPHTVATDAAYRARRVRELVLQAAAATYAARGESSSSK